MANIIFIRGIIASGKSTLSNLITEKYKIQVINPDKLFIDEKFKKYKRKFENHRLKRIKYYFCLEKAKENVIKDISFIWDQPWRNIDGLKKTINILKKINPKVKIIAVEPAESAVLSGEKPGIHQIQGIGEGFVPKIVQDHQDLIDEVVKIKSKDAIKMQQKLISQHGLLIGYSSGANFLAAKIIKKKYEFENVVTIFPDRGERYLS